MGDGDDEIPSVIRLVKERDEPPGTIPVFLECLVFLVFFFPYFFQWRYPAEKYDNAGDPKRTYKIQEEPCSFKMDGTDTA